MLSLLDQKSVEYVAKALWNVNHEGEQFPKIGTDENDLIKRLTIAAFVAVSEAVQFKDH